MKRSSHLTNGSSTQKHTLSLSLSGLIGRRSITGSPKHNTHLASLHLTRSSQIEHNITPCPSFNLHPLHIFILSHFMLPVLSIVSVTYKLHLPSVRSLSSISFRYPGLVAVRSIDTNQPTSLCSETLEAGSIKFSPFSGCGPLRASLGLSLGWREYVRRLRHTPPPPSCGRADGAPGC